MKNGYQYKFQIDDKKALADKCSSLNIVFSKPENYTYSYFKPPIRIKSSFVVIRIKESDREKIIDMKIRNNKTEKWEHFDSGVERPDQLIKILETIGCKAMVIFRKTRQTYTNNFLRLDLDINKQIGTFLEVKFEPRSRVKAENFIKNLGLDPEKHDKRSVVEIYLSRQKGFL